jgi:hypothetical protein
MLFICVNSLVVFFYVLFCFFFFIFYFAIAVVTQSKPRPAQPLGALDERRQEERAVGVFFSFFSNCSFLFLLFYFLFFLLFSFLFSFLFFLPTRIIFHAVVTGKALKLNQDPPNPSGHWTNDDGKNMRSFFTRFAQQRKFDPLVAENWYRITRKDVMLEKVSLVA